MTESDATKSLITRLDQTLRAVFKAQRPYFFDIYQPEFKWMQEHVRTILNDIQVPLPANKVFPLDQVDNRQKALFAAIRHIWATV